MNEFLAILESNLRNYLPEEWEVDEVIIQRNIEVKGKRQTGVGIKVKNIDGVLMVYIDKLYKAFCEGQVNMREVFGRIISQLIDIHKVVIELMKEDALENDADAVKRTVCYRLVNFEREKDKLSNCPHRIIGENLALVYYHVMKDTFDRWSIQNIENDTDTFGLTEEQLYEAASVNTPNMYPVEILTMHPFFGLVPYRDWYELEDEELRDILSDLTIIRSHYNKSATAIFYPGILERIYKVVGGEFAVLPSSIEEMLYMPLPEGADLLGLTYMVRDINKKKLTEDMVLSETAYIFDGEKLVPIYPENEKSAASACC